MKEWFSETLNLDRRESSWEQDSECYLSIVYDIVYLINHFVGDDSDFLSKCKGLFTSKLWKTKKFFTKTMEILKFLYILSQISDQNKINYEGLPLPLSR